MGHRPAKQRLVGPLDQPHEERLPRAHATGEKQRGHHRHHGERENQRGGEGRHEGEGHRLEHLPLDPLQAEDRDEDDDHDQAGEQDRCAHLVSRLAKHLFGHPLPAVIPLPAAGGADGAVDHHDSPVDDHSEVNGPQAHQVGRYPGKPHRGQGGHRGEGDRGGHDQAGPHIAEQQQQHDDHEDHPHGNIFHDRVDRLGHQLRAVIEGVDHHPLGQRLLDGGDLLLHVGYDLPGIAPHDHHHHARHGLAVTVAGDGPLPQHRGKPHLTNVGDTDRRAVGPAGEHDVANVVERLDQPFGAD